MIWDLRFAFYFILNIVCIYEENNIVCNFLWYYDDFSVACFVFYIYFYRYDLNDNLWSLLRFLTEGVFKPS